MVVVAVVVAAVAVVMMMCKPPTHPLFIAGASTSLVESYKLPLCFQIK
jgi:hypothetical protein